MVRKRIAVRRPDGGIIMMFADEVKKAKAAKPLETASVNPAEAATKPKPKPRTKGGGKK